MTGSPRTLVKTLVMTHHLRREAVRKKIFFKTNIPPMTHTSK